MLRFRTLAFALTLWLLPMAARAVPISSVAPLLDAVHERAAEHELRAVRLRQQIGGILKTPALRKVRVGIEVLEAGSGVELLNHNADAPFNPASNTKILTTAAALSSLGTDFRYRTVLLAGPADKAAGEAKPGVLRGDLFVQGSGDPSLTPEGLAELALRLHRSGIERIEGEVRIDNQLRDVAQLTSQVEAPAYGPGALILGGDRYTVHVSPGEIGKSASVFIGPRLPYFVVRNEVRTVRGKRSRIVVNHEQRDDQLIVTVRGRIGAKSRPVRARQRLYDTSAWATATLMQAFADFGIVVRGGVKRGLPPHGPLTIVAEHKSEPLSRICHVINKDSNNFVADTLFKTLGAARFGLPGTLEKGARAVAEWLSPLGLTPERVHLVNGSGLTHENRLRPADLGQLLYKLYHSLDLGPEFLQSLAVGGIDGTISHRFHGALTGLVRGKTGTLSGVSVLSGYVGDRPGVMIFCIFVEGFRGKRLAAIRQAQGRIVEAIMRFVHDGQGPQDFYRPPTSLSPGTPPLPLHDGLPAEGKPPADSTPASDTVEESEDDEA